MKEHIIAVIRTLLALTISGLLWFVSGHIFGFLPVFIMIPLVAVYYYQSVVIYFKISGESPISTILGLIVSVSFIMLYIVKIGTALLFVKMAFIIGICLGILETFRILSIKLRLTSYN